MLLAPLLTSALFGLGFAVQEPAPDALPPVDHAGLSRELHAIADAHPDRVTPLSLGHSREGRRIEALRITGTDPTPARGAILLVANLDGPRVFSSSVALHHARALAEGYGSDARVTALLDAVTVYVVPRANPDAAEAFFAPVKHERTTGGRAVDDDRDGRMGEDPPADVNGDGTITWIRVQDPEGTWMPDPTDPRVMVEADHTLGERGGWKVFREGWDNDGDEEVAEDDVHDTVLNRNFPSGWEEHTPGMGLFPGDEPEARALMDFVIEHRDLVLVVNYGALDAMVEEPESVDDDARATLRIPPAGVLASDARLLARIGETYREVTGNEAGGEDSDAGSFQRWCYDHRGLLALNVVLWEMPLAEEEEAEEEEEEDAEPAEGGADDDAPAPSDDARRLAWAEGAGEDWRFVPWTSFPHPTLGAVEIGGFAPFARVLPPASARAGIAEAELAFLLGLGALVPRVEVTSFTREELGGGVWEVRAVIENRAPLPLQSRAARRSRTVRPARVRLELSTSKMLLSGRVQELLSDLRELDGRQEYTWLVRVPGDVDLVLTVDTDHAGSIRATAEVKQ